MEIQVPSWLTKDFLKYALEGEKEVPPDRTITVDNYEVDTPIAKGDHYVCEIFRVKIGYRASDDRPSNTSLIVKAVIKSEISDYMLKMGVFLKEARMYNVCLPKINRIFEGAYNLTPKSFSSDEELVLVLEDLKFEGYVMADRQLQLDFDHCVIALKTLAVYHAASVRLHEQQPNMVEDIGKELFFNEAFKESNQELSKLRFKLLAEESKSIPQLCRYVEKFYKFSETTWDTLVQLLNPKENSFNVMNHGDFWVNNMLFRYENGKPIGLKLIDFQLARYTSPAIDLTYFLYGSVQEDLRVQRTDDLLRVYLKELNEHLEKFNATQRLTEEELNVMMNTSEFFGLFVSVGFLPIFIADPKKVTFDPNGVKMEELKKVSNNPFRCYYKNEKLIDLLVKRMEEFEKKGWF